MRVLELLTVLQRWQGAGRRVALATLAGVRGSAPRDPGAVMAVRDDGEMSGSISGGCVEAALADEAQLVLRDRAARVVEYGISDAQAHSVGLTCGGTLRILVDEPSPAFVRDLNEALASERPQAIAVRLDESAARLAIFKDTQIGTLGTHGLDEAVCAEVRSASSGEHAAVRTFGENGEPHGEVSIFIERILDKPSMYIFGAIDFAAAMIRIGKMLGYDVTLCDARPAFAKADRFPLADRVVCEWPDDFLRDADVDGRTAIVALTHDEKFDVPLIQAALKTPAEYIGVMGSRRTNERRMAQLREAGVSAEECARICAPIGLDLGARTPEETAIAIAAEIVAQRHGRSGGRLTGGSGPLRGPRPGSALPVNE